MTLNVISQDVQHCTKCRLHNTATNGVPGEGPTNADIFLIGQAPGREEDKTGRPFVGRAGQLLNGLLKDIGLPREQVFITSVVKHFPPNNRAPRKDEIHACKPYLLRQLTIVKPKIVVLLGNTAQQALKDEPALANVRVLPTVHPAAAMRFPEMKKRITQDFKRLKHLTTKLL